MPSTNGSQVVLAGKELQLRISPGTYSNLGEHQLGEICDTFEDGISAARNALHTYMLERIGHVCEFTIEETDS